MPEYILEQFLTATLDVIQDGVSEEVSKHQKIEVARIMVEAGLPMEMLRVQKAEGGWPHAHVIHAAKWVRGNAIHQFFNDHVANRTLRNQERVHVTRHSLMDLRERCVRVLATCEIENVVSQHCAQHGEHESYDLAKIDLPLAQTLMPLIQDGTDRWGTEEYDGEYHSDLKFTVNALDKVLQLPENVTFDYYGWL